MPCTLLQILTLIVNHELSTEETVYYFNPVIIVEVSQHDFISYFLINLLGQLPKEKLDRYYMNHSWDEKKTFHHFFQAIVKLTFQVGIMLPHKIIQLCHYT
jgi:hypothetical protein